MKVIYFLLPILSSSMVGYTLPEKNNNEGIEKILSAEFLKEPLTDSTWQLDTVVQGVSFYYKIVSCGNEDVVLLSIENKNSSQVIFSWSDEVLVDGVSLLSESKKTFLLSATENKEGSCGISNLELLEIKLSNISPTGSHITGFHFKKIAVN